MLLSSFIVFIWSIVPAVELSNISLHVPVAFLILNFTPRVAFAPAVIPVIVFVVVGENPGSKLSEAQKYGVKIISEKEFLDLI